ncbi:MAG: peptide ABC transporter substrate-binding protein [Bdellovibrionota bacterium]|mgnify:CR=1 FL=1
MKNLCKASILVILTLMYFVSCTGKKNSSSSVKNTELKIGTSQEFETLNPLIMTMSQTTYMYHMTGRKLVHMDPDTKWYPQLAKEIPTIENGKAKFITVGGKKKIIAEWEILENAKWGDGVPVTCHDFAMARTIALSPNVSIADKESYDMIEKIDIDSKNPKKCSFTYKKARWDFNRHGTFYPVPKHLEDEPFKKFNAQKEGYEKNSTYSKAPTNPGLYNGPYLISEIKLSDHVTFIPNPHFYGEKPKIQKVIIKLIPNTAALEANLRSGTVDMISTLGLSFDQAVEFDKKINAEKLPYLVTFTKGITYEHIDFNLDHPFFKDGRVRRAMIQALDRESLTKSLFEGKQESAIHFVSPKDPWFTRDEKYVIGAKFSKRDAEKLLAEAGWKKGEDGYLYKDNKKFSVNFGTTAGNKIRELVQVYLQDQWKQVGIEVNIKNEPARVFFGETTKKRKFDLAMYAWVSSPENIPRSTFHSTSIPSTKNGYSGQNQPGWNNPKVDKLIEDLEIEFDSKKRTDLAWELQKVYTEEAPVIPLYYRSDVSAVPPNLKNYRPSGHQFHETGKIEEWTLE